VLALVIGQKGSPQKKREEMFTKEIVYKGKARTVEFHTVYTLEALAELPLEKLEQYEEQAGRMLALWMKLPKKRNHTIEQHLADYAYYKQAHTELIEELLSRQEIEGN